MRSQLVLDLNKELIVDNFAGGGGASTGIFLATGRHVDLAVNHDHDALSMHEMNHSQTLHICEDVWAVDPLEVTKGRPVGLAHFSPDCKDHSKAKGGKPRSKKIRGLAWVMVKWGGLVAPRVMTLENVEEFQDWGRLVAKRCKLTGRVIKIDGTVAAPGEHVPAPQQMLERDKRNLGRIFRRFIRRLRECLRKLGYAMGYRVEWKEMRACDNGVPTIRKRLFLIARRDGQPIVFPEPTHGAPDSEGVRKKRLKPFRTAAECIDFSRPCPSIFLTKAEARKLRIQRPLANASNRRIAKGVERYVMKSDKPFLVCLTHHGSDRVESIDEPFRTTTGANRGERAVVIPSVTKFRTGSIGSNIADSSASAENTCHPERSGESRAQSSRAERDSLPQAARRAAPAGAGNDLQYPAGSRAELVAPTLIQTGYGERDGQEPRALDIEKPLGTVVGGGVKHAVVEAQLAAPFLTEHANASAQRNFSADEPLRTQCAEVVGGHFATVVPLLAGVGGRAAQSRERGIDEPTGTCTTKADTVLIAAHVARDFGKSIGSAADEPIGATTAGGGGKSKVVSTFLARTAHGEGKDDTKRRGRGAHPIDEPLPTTCASNDLAVAGVHVARQFGTAVGMPADQPMGTVMADGAGGKNQLVSTFVAKHFTDKYGQVQGSDIRAPMPTVTATDHNSLVGVSLVKYYGSDQDPKISEPMHTVTSKHRIGETESALMIPPLTPERAAMALKVAAFLREHGVEVPGEYATTRSGLVIHDIGMRMLEPRELYKAQGFPDDYIIDQVWVKGPDGAWLTDEHGQRIRRKLPKHAQVRMCGNSVCPEQYAAIVRANCPELITWNADDKERAA